MMPLKSHDIVINDEEGSNVEQSVKNNVLCSSISHSTSSAAPTLSSTTSSSDRTTFATTKLNNRDNSVAVCT